MKIFRLDSLVILRSKSSLKILITSFLIFLAWGPLTFSKQTKPSSLYKSTISFPYFSPNTLKMYTSTSSQIFVKSKLPVVTSNSGSPFLLIHTDVLLNKRDLRKCIMVFTSSLLIVINDLAWFIAFMKDLLRSEGKILRVQIAVLLSLFLIKLITVSVSLDWFTNYLSQDYFAYFFNKKFTSFPHFALLWVD